MRDVVNNSGAVVASYEFDEYGRRLATSETGASTQKTFVGGMSVQDEVADTGLMMMGHRFYAPDLGRFLNRDPIGFAGGMNLFEYAGGRPTQAIDPRGLEQHSVGFYNDGGTDADRLPGMTPSDLLMLTQMVVTTFYEPADYAMMAHDLRTNGFNPWMLLGALPVISYGLFRGAQALSRTGDACLDPPSTLYRNAKPNRGPKGQDPPVPRPGDFTPRKPRPATDKLPAHPGDDNQLSTFETLEALKKGWYAILDTNRLPKGSVYTDGPPHWMIDFDHPDVDVERVMDAVIGWGQKQ